ncbi:hypothetical protein LCGC14_1426270 [marine sediment metagenome]|uniref:Acetoacetate metabolism regulatory protein AtoC n=1 Tax=marine sediment metagenome TaxID=412755 RepID=A0A0F9JPW5_9ZZZZ
MLKILIVEDKEAMASMLKETLEAEGFFKAVIAPDGTRGTEMLRSESPDLVLTDLRLPGQDGIEVLKASKEQAPLRPVILMTAHGSIDTAVRAMQEGAYDFITKPFNIDHLLMKIRMAFENQRLITENMLFREAFSYDIGLPDIIGKSHAITMAAESIKKVSPQKTTILLTGESGTGKELFARAAHHLSDRRDNHFVPINCAAIPMDLLESALFGHEKGSFTGAEKRKLGKFELANHGTVFLDEISEMDASLQSKLLRVLQEGEIDMVGSVEAIKVDVRVIAATNADLEGAVSKGAFREDLFYRLNVFPILIPPLRDRREDIPLLADFFLKKYAAEMNSPALNFSPEAMGMLEGAQWKGNVRELENTIERALILSEGVSIKAADISLGPVGSQSRDEGPGSDACSLEETARYAQRTAETRRIRQAMQEAGGNKTKAAVLLSVSYKTLLTKIKDYEIR